MDIFDFSYEFPSTIEELDKFNGKEFEIFLLEFFKKLGFSTRMTDDTNDKGIDLIVKMNSDSAQKIVGIQAKRWKSKVGADEIRSMLDGRAHYNLDEVWIVTTSDLTSAAKTTAMNNNIEIINRDRVEKFLEELKKRENVKFRQKNVTKSTDVILNTATGNKSDVKDDKLFEDLKELRTTLAKQHKLFPVYLVYNNATIEEIVLKKPLTLEELKDITGITENKISLFGKNILELITRYSEDSKIEIKKELILERQKISKYNNLKNEYAAYNDVVLEDLVKKLPTTLEELKQIKGFKLDNVDLFGEYLIKVIKRIKNII
ncbi:restriction endonuclease [Haploplasma axanthum]|uniref:ATP-dependent DNA helicase recQ n=1 Tax=Haploplasma axanthum TaxID=29552 RepID=A0A449BDQ6_HAPAX|nr:restriction endonuclease [Haploplasma axanthum]VEU80565.1 ATP-dependent DNA helicase recQ [Haploplasma axanthum]